MQGLSPCGYLDLLGSLMHMGLLNYCMGILNYYIDLYYKVKCRLLTFCTQEVGAVGGHLVKDLVAV